ncbi:hypothetical protein LSUE1_G004954, partial [Lachnellula suecica]
MHTFSVSKVLAFGLLVSAPLAVYAEPSESHDLEKKYVGGPASWVRAAVSLQSRHHTEAQIAAKKAKAGARDIEVLETRHHTEAQIAAKKAKASARDVETREPHHTEAQIAAKKAKASARDMDDLEA